MARPEADEDNRASRRKERRAGRAVWGAAILAAALGLTLAAGGAAQADQACPRCKRDVPDAYRYCPFDGARLPSPPCSRCHKPMQPDWRFCPFDGVSLTGAPSPAAAPTGEDATSAKDPTVGDGIAPAAAKGSAEAAAAAELPPPTGDNPIDTIDRLFRAIQGNNVAAIRKLYRWKHFFGETGADLEPRIHSYVSKLTDRVGPIAKRTDRIPIRVNLAPRNATLGIALRDRRTRTVVQEYEFELTDEGDGWRIVKVRP